MWSRYEADRAHETGYLGEAENAPEEGGNLLSRLAQFPAIVSTKALYSVKRSQLRDGDPTKPLIMVAYNVARLAITDLDGKR